MRLAVEKITDISAAYKLDLDADELNRQLTLGEGAGPQPFAGGATIDFNLSRIGPRLLLDGRVSAELALECGRCLQPFNQPLDETFSLALHLSSTEESDAQEDLELDEEQIYRIQVRDGEVELGSLLLEQVLLLVPNYPSCSENCAGLCPYCGVNRNLGRCNCEPKPFNNRFGKLKELDLDKP